jgi:hypothetical protein
MIRQIALAASIETAAVLVSVSSNLSLQQIRTMILVDVWPENAALTSIIDRIKVLRDVLQRNAIRVDVQELVKRIP